MEVAATERLRSSIAGFFAADANKLRRLVFGSGIFLFVCGLCTAAVTAWLMIIAFSPTPSGDQWPILLDLASGKKWFSPSWLWSQHNEHRLPLIRLATAADLYLFGAHGYLPYVLIFLTMSLHWLLWGFVLRKFSSLPGPVWAAIAGFFAFCIFCPNQWGNFYWPFQWTFIVTFFFASASFLALSLFAARNRPWFSIALSSAAAFLAEGGLASGLVTWPVLWLGTLGLPLRRRHRFVLVGTGVIAIALYLYGYQQPGYHSNPLRTIRQPGRIARYVLTYIDHCLSNYFVYPALAAIVLSSVVFAALVVLLRRPRTHALSVAITMTMGFIIGTGVMTALGRINFGVEQAAASRYQTPVMLYWACGLTALAIAAWELCSWRDLLVLNLAALAAVLLPIPNVGPLITELRARAAMLSFAGQSLDQGVLDVWGETDLVVPMPIVIPIARYLHSRGDAIGPPPPHLPDRATAFSKLDSGACEGRFEAVSPPLGRFDPGPKEVRADGWAVDVRRHGPVEQIVIVDDRRKVLAASSLHFEKEAGTKIPGVNGPVDWHVYVPVPSDSKRLQAIAIVGGRGCPLTGGFRVDE